MEFGNIRGIARTTAIIIVAAIIIIAAIAAVAYLYLLPEEKKVLGKILHTHGYRGSTSEVLRASGFLDGVTGKPLPPNKGKVIEFEVVPVEQEYPTHMVDLDVDTPYIGYVPLGIYNPWDMLNKDAFEWYCRDVLGWKYKVAWPDADIKKQNDMTEALIEEGVDALVVCPLDSVANAKIADLAEEAGIPLVLFGIDMYHRWPLAFVQRDDYESGWYCGKYVLDELKEKYPGEDIQVGINVPIVDVGNSWDAVAEYPYVRAAMEANPDIVAVFEVMGGFQEAWVSAAEDLGWSEQKMKDVIAVDVDFFPVNLDGYINGYQDYCRMMPTGGYMTATSLEILKQFWKYGPEALPKMGETFTVEDYVPELGIDATVEPEGFAPLQWYEHSKWGVVGYTIRPATCGSDYTPWVLIPDRVVTEADYQEDFIYWNWPIWGYPH